jgi:flagellar export protein FliJ
LLDAQSRALTQQQRQIAEDLERRRLALVEGNRQVRVLEKLREKQAHEFSQQAAVRDVKLMDELAQRSPARTGETFA